jgi:phage baseplate assembly protein W
MTIYKGFSTYNRKRRYTLTDFDLVKQDLFNHFNIRRGEKLMRPEVGTRIWGWLFEPFTEELRENVINEVRNVVSADPRLALDSIEVLEYDYGLGLKITVTYITENLVEELLVEFNKETNQVAIT